MVALAVFQLDDPPRHPGRVLAVVLWNILNGSPEVLYRALPVFPRNDPPRGHVLTAGMGAML